MTYTSNEIERNGVAAFITIAIVLFSFVTASIAVRQLVRIADAAEAMAKVVQKEKP